MQHKAEPYEDQSVNRPVDMNDILGAFTAIEAKYPETFSERARKVLDYLDDTAFLFFYKGKWILTDESLYLTQHGDGTADAPFGAPRWTGDTLEELEQWLESVADDYDNDGNVPGWESSSKGGDPPESEPGDQTEISHGDVD